MADLPGGYQKKVLEDLFRSFIFMSIYIVVWLENEKVVEGDLFDKKVLLYSESHPSLKEI